MAERNPKLRGEKSAGSAVPGSGTSPRCDTGLSLPAGRGGRGDSSRDCRLDSDQEGTSSASDSPFTAPPIVCRNCGREDFHIYCDWWGPRLRRCLVFLVWKFWNRTRYYWPQAQSRKRAVAKLRADADAYGVEIDLGRRPWWIP